MFKTESRPKEVGKQMRLSRMTTTDHGDDFPPTSFSDIGGELQKGLASLRQYEVFTDFEVIVQGQSFRCHKLILAAMSDFFKAMFLAGMQETVNNQTVIDTVTPETFQLILDLMYYWEDGDPHLLEDRLSDDEELKNLILAADMFQMSFLSNICVDLISNTMSVDNCVERWKMCKSLSCQEFGKDALRFIVCNFNNEAVRDCLVTLDYEEFFPVISSPYLDVDQEITVWEVISKWIDVDKTRRIERLPELLQCCDLIDIDRTALTENLAFDDKIRQNDAASKLLQNAIRFKNHPGDQGNMCVKFRKIKRKDQMHIMLCAVSEINTPLMYVIRGNKTVKTFAPFDTNLTEFACCVIGCDMYFCGGQEEGMDSESNSLYKRALYGKRITFHKNTACVMPYGLKRHAMVASDTHLFTVGGRSRGNLNQQMFEYEIRSNTWDIHGEIVAPVENASAVHVHGNIYIFGGVTQVNSEAAATGSDIIQSYDISTKTATLLTGRLPSPCAFSCAFIKHDQIFVVTGNGEVVRLSDTMDPELITSIPEFGKRKYYGVRFVDQKLEISDGVTEDQEGNKTFCEEEIILDMESGAMERNRMLYGKCFFGTLRVVVG